MKYYFPQDKVLTKDIITKFIERDRGENARKIKLYDYYKGKHSILSRAYEDPSKPNNRVVNPYANYITTMMTGYFVGEPVEYTSEDEQALAALKEIFEYNDEPSVNKEIAKWQSICGEGYDIIYVDKDGNTRFKALPALGMIPIYNDDIDEDLLYVIRYWTAYDIETNMNLEYVEVYSRLDITKYQRDLSGLRQLEQKYHVFGQVPITPYYNNAECQGDFELVISEIDAYDSFESDSVNEADYFADSYLVLSGMEGTEPEDIAGMKANRVLLFPEGGRGEWLTKSVNDSWIENEKKRLDQDIHKFSFCPPMTDENFASNASGVAMRYKLLGLEDKTGVKETEFEKGLRRRIELIYGIMRKVNGDMAYLDINIVFTRNLPQDLSAMVDTVVKLDGVISDESRVALLPLDLDAEAELAAVEEKKLQNYALFADNFRSNDDDTEKSTEE
jgi:SPP1 family phage portal protein